MLTCTPTLTASLLRVAGMSYSSFAYDVKATTLQHDTIDAGSCADVGIVVSVQNSGAVAADEVVQAYIRWTATTPASVTPSLSLVDFARVHIAAGAATTVPLTMTPRSLAILTDPRCSTVPHTLDTALSGVPFKTMQVGGAGAGAGAEGVAACCSGCGALEQCEAFTVLPSGTCQLFSHWGFTSVVKGAVSGEPLSQWVLRPGTIEVLVGGSSSTAVAVGTLRITGTETPLTACPTPLPNTNEA